jgi:hypothetical protein
MNLTDSGLCPVVKFDISNDKLLGSIIRVSLFVYCVYTCDMFPLRRFGVQDEGCKEKHGGQCFSSPNHTCYLQQTKVLRLRYPNEIVLLNI